MGPADEVLNDGATGGRYQKKNREEEMEEGEICKHRILYQQNKEVPDNYGAFQRLEKSAPTESRARDSITKARSRYRGAL